MGQSDQGSLEAFYRDVMHELDEFIHRPKATVQGAAWWSNG